MDRILHDTRNSERILRMTADTMILVNRQGVCVDIDAHSNLWFLQEEFLLEKNIGELLPADTREKIKMAFHQVLSEQKTISRNYKMDLKEGTYFFKCIMHPYDDMVLCQYRDITTRSTVKLQLERTNNELREIQKVAMIGQWSYNSQKEVITYWGYTGIICEEMVSRLPIADYLKLLLVDDRAIFEEWMEKNRNGETTESIDYRISYNGQIFYIRLKTYCRDEMPDGSFNLEGYIQNVTDIQRRRNDINTLTHAINNARESIFAAKEDGTIIFANRQFIKNHQIPANIDLKTLKIYEVVGDMQSLESWQRRCKQAKPGECANFIAYHPLKYNKSVRALEGTLYNVTSDEGELSYWSFAHDISDRLKYESQIKRLNRIMDTTMKNLPASIVVKDINNDFKYIYRNRKLYDRDISVAEAIGKNDFDFHPYENALKKRQDDLLLAQTGKELHWIKEDVSPEGKLRILDKRKIKVESNDFSPVIISIEWDITELELMKRALQQEKEKAETSDKQKSAFLANMSHEIRTPLNAIVGFSRIIAESSDAEERKAFYEIVDANNERLLQLINEILDLSKIESGIVEFTIAPMKLGRLCRDIYDALVFRCPEGVQLVFEPSDESIYIDSDKNRVFQVISNLITNAYKFTTKGTISYGYRKNGTYIEFHVSDTGMGIDADKVSKVFERFVMVNNFAQGTGLGLSICKTIVEKLGGEISVTSEVGKGTVFTFTLPAIKDSAATTEADANAESATGTNATVWETKPKPTERAEKLATILIAEDTDCNYQLLEAILGKSYHLERARDGMEAVTMFEEAKPDLVLMDIKMPNLNGLEATKIIRELNQQVPIIIQSAFAYDYDRNAAQEAGCSDFISKPIAQNKLKEVVEKWLNKK